MGAPAQPIDPLLGTLLAGKYQILERVASGGMGAVYKAHHVLMDRIVAIKVVHTRHAANDPSCLQRFQIEAQASSCLSHANIVTVFDFGTTDSGMAYLVMEYLQGEGLDAVLRRDKHLSTRRMLSIFSQACNALAHAHEKGIVHRDLKPSNIMLVTSSGLETVKLVDFGIAKILPGRSHSTPQLRDDGIIIGSPLYMSPEQCMGDAQDERSDVYSLGCLLYEALTGQPAITDSNVLGIIYRHLNETPHAFSMVAPDLAIPPEIEAVVFKALEKDPSLRHQSMTSFGEELSQAGRISGVGGKDRLKYAERSDLCDVVFFEERTTRPVHRKQKTLDAIEQHYLRHLREAADQFGKNCPDLVPYLNKLADFYCVRKQAHKAEPHLAACVQILVSHYGAWDIRVGEAVKRLADYYYRDAARCAEAESLYLDLLSIKRKSLGLTHPDIACILLRLADLYLSTGQIEQSQQYFVNCLSTAELIFGPNDPILTPILTGLATVRRVLDCPEDAARLYQRALVLKELHLGPNHPDCAGTLICLGIVFRDQSKYVDAERAFGRALTILEQKLGPDHADVSNTLLLLADMYSVQDMLEDAEAIYRRAIESRERHLPEDHIDIARAYEMFAVHCIRTKQYERAETAYVKSLTIKERALGLDHIQVAVATSFLANIYHAQEEFDLAEAYYKRAIKRMKGKPDCRQQLAENFRSLGDLYTTLHRYEEAEPAYLTALSKHNEHSESLHEPNMHATEILSSLMSLYSAANDAKQALLTAATEDAPIHDFNTRRFST